MNSVNELCGQFAKTCLQPLEQTQDHSDNKILEPFKPYVCELSELEAIQKMSLSEYYQKEPAGLFVLDQATKISQVIISAQAQSTIDKDIKISRKTSGLDWKVTVIKCQKTALLLPRKDLFHDLVGNCKRGRIALMYSQDTTTCIWSLRPVWNLTAIKEKAESFLLGRHVEKKLQDKQVAHLFVQYLYDVESIPTRSCYYEKLKCLIFCTSDCTALQNIALSAAQKIASLHSKEIALIDLKRENTLITPNFDVLFCDSDLVTFDVYRKTRTPDWGGTAIFYPPELLQQYKFTDPKSGDTFAFGCMLLELLFKGKLPWNEKTRRLEKEVLDKYKNLALRATIKLDNMEVLSAQRLLFYIAQCALHPLRTKRPEMSTICKYLARKCTAENDLTEEEINEFLLLEEESRADDVKTPPTLTGSTLHQ